MKRLHFFNVLAAAMVWGAAALPASAATWAFDLPAGALLSGGTLAGSFSATDANNDGSYELSELSAFSVVYTGAAGVTSSFAITQAPDAFDFIVASKDLVFSVTDALSNSVSVNTYDGGSYSVVSAIGPDAGVGALTISAVPEPSTWLSLAAGLATVGWVMRRRAR